MIEEIYGQGVTFDTNTCDGYCMPLYGAAGCGDGCGDAYILNSTFEGLPVLDWTIGNGGQISPGVFITDLSNLLDLSQSVTIPADDYLVFYSFGAPPTGMTCDLTITNGVSALELFDTASGDNSTGVVEITLTGASARTILLEFDSVLAQQPVTTGYIHICPKDAYQPETDFCFQLPLRDTGSDLLDAASINSNIVPLQAVITGSDTGAINTGKALQACATGLEINWFVPHMQVSDDDDGYYFFKYEIGSSSITLGEIDGVPQTLQLRYKSGGVVASANFQDNTLTGSFKSQDPFAPAATPTNISAVVYTEGQDDGTGSCYRQYDVEDLDTELWRMWSLDSATLEDDTQYRLYFKNFNSTGTTVKIYDESAALIFQATSDGVLFNKVFQTGTLPGGKTVDIRFEFDNFLDSESSAWNDSILTDAVLYKQCAYTVDLLDDSDTSVATLPETHATNAEDFGSSYNKNIEYCLDANSVGSGDYRMIAYDDCDSADNGELSNWFNLCNSLIGYKQITWTPSNNKTVGDYTLDYTNYPTTKFLWIKCDIQDLDIQNERTAYVQSDGFVNVPYSRARNLYTLVIHPLPRHMREALSFAFQDTFYIDGVAYQVIDEDAYSPLFTARYDNAIRVPVHKVGAFSTSRNA